MSLIPGYPHHIMSRENRKQEIFFCGDDYRQYIDLMAEWCSRCGVDNCYLYCSLLNDKTHYYIKFYMTNVFRRQML
jgi:REP-associated tyrosine transposase